MGRGGEHGAGFSVFFVGNKANNFRNFVVARGGGDRIRLMRKLAIANC